MSLEGTDECADALVDWLLAFLCPLPDGEMVLPAFPWSLELGRHRQEPGFTKGLLEIQINTVTNAVTVNCVSSSNCHRTALSSSLPEGGRENRLKLFLSQMAALTPGTPGPLAPAAGPCLGQRCRSNGTGK